MIRRSPEGAPLSDTSATSRPSMRAACAFGLPMVAEAKMKTGDEPWKRATRWSRRSTLARCEPKTPRYVCSSSMTT